MNFSYRRSYRGPIEAVLLHWAGTTMDFGCTRLRQCGAHYVVDSIADIMPGIEEIQARIRRGETP